MEQEVTSAQAAKATPGANAHQVTIQVNNKPVNITGPRVTGLEIKQAAVDQGVQIKLDFVLSEIEANGKSHIVGDDDKVTVNKNSKFRAVDNDDNS